VNQESVALSPLFPSPPNPPPLSRSPFCHLVVSPGFLSSVLFFPTPVLNEDVTLYTTRVFFFGSFSPSLLFVGVFYFFFFTVVSTPECTQSPLFNSDPIFPALFFFWVALPPPRVITRRFFFCLTFFFLSTILGPKKIPASVPSPRTFSTFFPPPSLFSKLSAYGDFVPCFLVLLPRPSPPPPVQVVSRSVSDCFCLFFFSFFFSSPPLYYLSSPRTPV